MITSLTGDLLKSDAEALVNAVNCVGVMGKGLALQFKQAFPNNFEAYRKACQAGRVQPGKVFTCKTGLVQNPRYIINFPTKRHWRDRSLIEDIESGLAALVETIKEFNIQSVAIPPLGCGLGGLQWNSVRPVIDKAFGALTEVQIYLYEP